MKSNFKRKSKGRTLINQKRNKLFVAENLLEEPLNYEYSDDEGNNELIENGNDHGSSDDDSFIMGSKTDINFEANYEPCIQNGFIEEVYTPENDYLTTYFDRGDDLMEDSLIESDDCSDNFSEEAKYGSDRSESEDDQGPTIDEVDSAVSNNNLLSFKFNSSCLSKLAARTSIVDNNEPPEINQDEEVHLEKRPWNLKFEDEEVFNSITSIDDIFNSVKPFTHYCTSPQSPFLKPTIRPPTRQKEPSPTIHTASTEDDVISISCSDIEQTHEEPEKPSSRIECPDIFSNLCIFHFFLKRCIKSNCRRTHNVETLKFLDHLKRYSPEDLIEAYYWAKKEHQTFFCRVFKQLAKAISFTGRFSFLVVMINDLFLDLSLNRESEMYNILSLISEEMGFKEAVNFVLENVELEVKTPVIHIIISLLVNQKEIEEIYEVLKRVTLEVYGELDPKAIEALINKALSYPQSVNKNLIQLFDELIQRNLVDGTKIRPDLIGAINMLLRHYAKEKNCENEPFSDINEDILSEMDALESVSQVNLDPDKEERVVEEFMNKIQEVVRSRPSGSEPSITKPPSATSSNKTPPSIKSNPKSSQSESSVKNYIHPLTPVGLPKFGFPNFHRDFRNERFLHNFLPLSPVQTVDLHDEDIQKLDRAVREGSGQVFLSLLELYNQPCHYEYFITNVIADLTLSPNIYITFRRLLESIYRHYSNHSADLILRGILEVIALSVVIELKSHNMYNECVHLLENYFNDWDSLASAKAFIPLTIMGKYLLFAYVFSAVKRCDIAYEVLHRPNLKLLEDPSCWPYPSSVSDIQRRQKILESLFQEGSKYNIVTMMDLYKTIFKSTCIDKRTIDNFNQTMTTILDNNNMHPVLKQILDDIAIFEKHMSDLMLKAYFKTLCTKRIVKSKDIHSLFEICIRRGIYQAYTGQENVISIKTNTSSYEISLILENYFKNLSKYPAKDVQIEIQPPPERAEFEKLPNVLKESYRSMNEIYNNLKEILEDEYFIRIPMITSSTIHLKYRTVAKLIDDLQKSCIE